MYTAGSSLAMKGIGVQTATDTAKTVSPMARYAYQNELGEQVRDALASRVFVLSDAIAVMRMAQSH